MDTRCLEWTEGVGAGGYGKAKWGGKTQDAHRLAWREWFGEIPEGMVVCHRCDNPRCCRVSHLFLGTKADNSADMVSKGRGPKPICADVRRAIAADRRDVNTVADEYRIAPLTVYRIRQRAKKQNT